MAAPQLELTNKYTGDIFQGDGSPATKSIFVDWLKDLVHWWYISMPVWYILSLRRVLTVIDDQFSISLLILNFFVPWHRDGTFVGFFIGIIMKLLFLPIGISIFIFTTLVYISFILIWFFLPLITFMGIVATPFLNSIIK